MSDKEDNKYNRSAFIAVISAVAALISAVAYFYHGPDKVTVVVESHTVQPVSTEPKPAEVLPENSPRKPESSRIPSESSETALPVNLVAYYPFDGDAMDKSVYKNHAQVYGPILTNDRFSNPNRAYMFDGVNDYIEIPAINSINFGSGDFSISLWLKFGSQFGGSHNYSTVFIKSVNFDYPYEGFTMFVDYPESGMACFRLDATQPLHSAIRNLNDNTWKHFVCIRKGNTIKMYINGYLDSYRDIQNINITNSAPIVLGANHQDRKLQNYQGIIDNLMIYNYALDDKTIASLYKSEKNNN
ncbi:MAG: LamG domain-containing protein [Candidatus Brocadiaceae bacterium]|nr:LamG domain-containing protein [Candidatus Brocadiaceae bacterium]